MNIAIDEPVAPFLGRYLHAHAKRWTAKIASLDAYVFVTPEYNYRPDPRHDARVHEVPDQVIAWSRALRGLRASARAEAA